MADTKLIRASDGSGEAVRATVTSARSIASTTLVVDAVTNFPAYFIATVGTIGSDSFLTPSTVQVFNGHLSGSDIIIDSFAPGYSDLGNSVGDVVLLKPTTPWADNLADVIEVSHEEDGTLSANSVDTPQLVDGAVTNDKLATGAGQPGNYTSWTPTLSGRFTDGDWTKNCSYTQVGKKVNFVFDITATDATPMSGGSGEATFTLPVTAASGINLTNNLVLGIGRALDSGTAVYGVQIEITSTTQARIRVLNTSGTYLGSTTMTSTIPMTWTTSDAITIAGEYEAA